MKDLIEKMYSLCSRYKPGQYLDACTVCCMTESDAAAIKSMSLRVIPRDLLEKYQDAAKPERLDVRELKYFAPRYLELVSDFEFPSFEPLLSLSRFGYLKPSDWTGEERKLLDEFAILFFRNYVNAINKAKEISPIEVLLMFHKGKFRLENLLEEWLHCKSIESLVKFSNFLDDAIDNRGMIRVRDAFSDDDFNKKIDNWLSDEQVRTNFRTEIERVIMNPPEMFTEVELEELSWKYDWLN